MKVLPLFFASLIMIAAFGDFSFGQEKDPRLEKILELIRTSQENLEAGIKARTEKYLADLRDLEKKTQATGDLDNVLQVTKERESWEKSTPNPAPNPKDSSVLLDLRKLRYYFDLDLAKISEEAEIKAGKAKTEIGSQLDELIRELTTEGKIDLALEVRNIKKNFSEGALALAKSNEPEMSPESVASQPSGELSWAIGKWTREGDTRILEINSDGTATHSGNGTWNQKGSGLEISWKNGFSMQISKGESESIDTVTVKPDGKTLANTYVRLNHAGSNALLGTVWLATRDGFGVVKFNFESSGELEYVGKNGFVGRTPYKIKDDKVVIYYPKDEQKVWIISEEGLKDPQNGKVVYVRSEAVINTLVGTTWETVLDNVGLLGLKFKDNKIVEMSRSDGTKKDEEYTLDGDTLSLPWGPKTLVFKVSEEGLLNLQNKLAYQQKMSEA